MLSMTFPLLNELLRHNDAKDTLETAFDKAEQATAEALQPLSADLEASPIPTDASSTG